jgi:hypothetical protein
MTAELETCRWSCKDSVVSGTMGHTKWRFIELSIEMVRARKCPGNPTDRAHKRIEMACENMNNTAQGSVIEFCFDGHKLLVT